jgi:EAL domain-containing protein (putative c-di-GMP-specific phosphodiesterase class I)
MCDRAGMALDTVKDNLHDRVAFYEDTIYERLQLEHELSAQLPGAIRRGELRFDLQPQVEPQGATLGAECLVRWDHPKRGLLMPGVFLPYFEKNYMVVQLDQFIWELACKQLRRWDKEGLQDLYLSVNVSPKDLECINVYDVLLGLVKKYDLDPNRLRVEITESALMENPREQIKWIGRLREAGFYVEMDDFGSGYSSFSMLKDISIDAIKLDMRFLSKSIHEERGKKIIHTIVELARQLKMTVVVEGVETEEQVAFLKQIGCDVFQGYFYARPMSVEDFEQRIQKEKSVRDVTEK